MPEFNEKECSKCHLWRGPEWWHYYLGKPQQPCKDCKKAYRASRRDHYLQLAKDWKKNNVAKVKVYKRNKDLRDKFGITYEQYCEMLADQEHRCAVCRRQQLTKRLAVDHCHKTGTIRGLLCDKCNRGIGLLGDDIGTLARAIAYLFAAANPNWGDIRHGQEREPAICSG